LIDPSPQLSRTPPDDSSSLEVVEAVAVSHDLVERCGRGPPPPPIVRQHVSDAVGVDAVVADGMVGEDSRGVFQILLVDLEHLQLGKKKVGQGDGVVLEVQSPGQAESVAHHDAFDEDVELTLVCRIPKVEALMPVEAVELLIGDVAEFLEHRLDRSCLPRSTHQVEIFELALERGPSGRRTPQPHREPAGHTKNEVCLLNGIEDARHFMAQIGKGGDGSGTARGIGSRRIPIMGGSVDSCPFAHALVQLLTTPVPTVLVGCSIDHSDSLGGVCWMRVDRIVDLSLVLDPDTEVYPGDPRPRFRVATTISADGYNLLALEIGSQSGTHVDSPYHFLDSGPVLERCPLSLFVGPGVVVDLRGKLAREPIVWADLEPCAPAMGPGVILALHTGWSDEHYGTERYFDHPFLDADACSKLLALGVRTFLIDCINLDETVLEMEANRSFPCHNQIAAAQGIISENITNLGAIDFEDPIISVLPIRLGRDADGAPCRAVALRLAT
jgi:kynurenine formamidase